MANSLGSPLRGEVRSALNTQMKELEKLTAQKLRERYQELFGSESTSSCRRQLIRRIGWKLQALEYGDLSERARCRIVEISQDPGSRIHLPAVLVPIRRPKPSPRVHRRNRPAVDVQTSGTELRREYRGKTVVAKVLETGFEFDGQVYGSLSAVARAATGTAWNGLVFFGIKKWNQSRQDQRRAAS